MNRRIRKELVNIRNALDEMETILDEYDGEELTEEVVELAQELTPTTDLNWTAADEEPKKEGIYLSQLKELSNLKDVEIIGQVTTVHDVKAYVKKDKSGTGMIYRFVLSDESDEITVITFDDMAAVFKQYPIGTKLKITNAWKVKANKHDVLELHVGNYAKVEVVD